MAFEINTRDLRNAVQLTTNAVSKKTTNPILKGIKLEVEGDILHIYATDLQTGFHKWLEIKSDGKNFSTVVEQNIFLEIISNLNYDTLNIDLDGVLKISSGNSVFKLPTMNPELFPSVTFDVRGNIIEIDRTLLTNMIDKVIFCVAKDSSPFSASINAIYWDFTQEGFLNLVATDSYRLAIFKHQLENGDRLSPFLLSLKSMNELRTILSESKEEKIKIVQDISQVLFDFEEDNNRVIFNVVEANFPDYISIIPQKFITEIKSKSTEFLGIMKRMSIVSKQEDLTLFNINDGYIQFYADSPEVGEAREEITVGQKGKNLEIGYSPKFFREALEKVETAEFELKISGEEQPAILKPAEDDSYMFIIMPKRK